MENFSTFSNSDIYDNHTPSNSEILQQSHTQNDSVIFYQNGPGQNPEGKTFSERENFILSEINYKFYNNSTYLPFLP